MNAKIYNHLWLSLLGGILVAWLFSGCGLPIPTEGAIGCSNHIFVEQGVTRFDCPKALAAVDRAEHATGINLSDAMIEFMAGDNIGEFGHPDALGLRNAGSIAVVASGSNLLIHEAFHFRDGEADHCNWSSPARIAIHEVNQLAGGYTDGCAHVRCESHQYFIDDEGQVHGYDWSCK